MRKKGRQMGDRRRELKMRSKEGNGKGRERETERSGLMNY